jgi:hypothetical protein
MVMVNEFNSVESTKMDNNKIKGSVGDRINLMLTTVAFNFKKWARELMIFFWQIFIALFIANKKYERAF